MTISKNPLATPRISQELGYIRFSEGPRDICVGFARDLLQVLHFYVMSYVLSRLDNCLEFSSEEQIRIFFRYKQKTTYIHF